MQLLARCSSVMNNFNTSSTQLKTYTTLSISHFGPLFSTHPEHIMCRRSISSCWGRSKAICLVHLVRRPKPIVRLLALKAIFWCLHVLLCIWVKCICQHAQTSLQIMQKLSKCALHVSLLTGTSHNHHNIDTDQQLFMIRVLISYVKGH